MKKFVRGLLTVAIVATAVSGSPATPQASAAWCKAAPSLSSNATLTHVTTYSTGATFDYYTLPPGITTSNYPTRLSVFKGDLNDYQMSNPHSLFGQTGNQRVFANSVPRLATYVNTDFIGVNNMPYSAVISGGKMIYSPAAGSIGVNGGSTRVLGWGRWAVPEADGIAKVSNLSNSSATVAVAGVNLRAIPSSSVIAYTAKYPTATTPRGAYAILVSGGRVTRAFPRGTASRPASGSIVFQAVGAGVGRLKRFLVGRPAKYTVPTSMQNHLVAETVAPTGYVRIGSTNLPIKAINFEGANPSGANVYDSNFGGTQTVGAATFLTDLNGVVTAASPSRGVRYTLSSSRMVFQVASDFAYLVSSLKVGQKLTVVNRYSTAGHNNITEASGRGSLLLVDGNNVEKCSGTVEDIRPRTAIGWNEKGAFWVATTTMGQSWNDGGYRLGGSTVHQLGDWLKSMGATQAVSFDGGGSTTQFITLNGAVSRQDLPENEWIRDIPVGMAFSPMN